MLGGVFTIVLHVTFRYNTTQHSLLQWFKSKVCTVICQWTHASLSKLPCVRQLALRAQLQLIGLHVCPKLWMGYSRDIFHADEAGLFIRCYQTEHCASAMRSATVVNVWKTAYNQSNDVAFGIYKVGYIQLVEQWDADTVLTIIQKFVALGITIWSNSDRS